MDPGTDALAAAIRELRAERGISQAVLAERAGKNRNYLASLERGERENPTWGVLCAVARGLGVPLSQLIVRAEEIARRDGMREAS